MLKIRENLNSRGVNPGSRSLYLYEKKAFTNMPLQRAREYLTVTNRIPNQYHFVFGLKRQLRPFHLVHYICLKSCLEVNRPEKVFFYYHHEPYGRLWNLIKDRLTLIQVDLEDFVRNFDYSDKFVKKFSYAHHSDFIRLKELIRRGGIYADIDTIFVNRPPVRMLENQCVLGREADVICQRTGIAQKSLCNAVIMSEPGGGFITQWIAKIEDAFDGTWSNHSTFLPYALSQEFPDKIHVEPIRSFFFHGASVEGIEMLFRGCDLDQADIYSMHLWSHLWWSRRRRDFSTFHAGQLTENYIRNTDTTYTVIARKFLPAKKQSIFSFSRI